MDKILRDPVSRRAFLARLSAAGLGAVALPLLAGCDSSKKTNSNNGYSNANFPNIPGRSANEVVLNFALTLEIAEADLYKQALNRASANRNLSDALDTQLPAPGTTGNYTMRSGFSTGGLSAGAAAAAYLYLVQFAYVEATHRDFLTAVLTSLGAPQAQANAKGYAFPNNEPGADLKTIMANLYPIEETGVRAYLGAAPTLDNNNIAQTATAIYSTEARHSASIAYIIGLDPGPTPNISGTPSSRSVTGSAYPHTNTFEYFSTPVEVLNAVSAAYFVK